MNCHVSLDDVPVRSCSPSNESVAALRLSGNPGSYSQDIDLNIPSNTLRATLQKEPAEIFVFPREYLDSRNVKNDRDFLIHQNIYPMNQEMSRPYIDTKVNLFRPREDFRAANGYMNGRILAEPHHGHAGFDDKASGHRSHLVHVQNGNSYPRGRQDAKTWSDHLFTHEMKRTALAAGAHSGATSKQTIQMVEIFPGVDVLLRGANETWNAIQNDFYSPATCASCTLEIFCIENAEYVLCPRCKVISPLNPGDDHRSRADKGDGHHAYGVGLGFSFENLARWQNDIICSRRKERVKSIQY